MNASRTPVPQPLPASILTEVTPVCVRMDTRDRLMKTVLISMSVGGQELVE